MPSPPLPPPQCVPKHGHGLLFLGDTGSQVLVCGQGERGGVVSWWDTLMPWSSMCVAELRGRKAAPSCMELMQGCAPAPGGVLVFGDEAGGGCGGGGGVVGGWGQGG